MQKEIDNQIMQREKIELELNKLKGELSAFADRTLRREISPELMSFTVGQLVHCQMSVRQVKKTFDVLKESLPMFNKFEFPSRHPIQKMVWSLPVLNDRQSIEFLGNSSHLTLCFDGSRKMNKSIFDAV